MSDEEGGHPAVRTPATQWPLGINRSHTAAEEGLIKPEVGLATVQSRAVEAHVRPLKIGLIDPYRFTQECLKAALDSLHPELSVTSFMTAKEFVAGPFGDLDIVVYYLHGSDASDDAIAQELSPICRAVPTTPLIVFSDVDVARQARFMRIVMKSGAHGFVLMRSADLPTTLAALRFVSAGGTYVPTEMVLSTPAGRLSTAGKRLTSRQADVLKHLKQGKANKIIAYDLGMSESTVKVHVRSIMRKMGAANRTEVVYRDSMRETS